MTRAHGLTRDLALYGAHLACAVVLCCISLVMPQAALAADHDGPLVLTGTDTYTIQDTTFSIDGPVTVQDSATLVIRNSTVVLVQGFHEEHPWTFSGSGRLILENSAVTSAYTYMFLFGEDSGASITQGELPDVFLVLCGDADCTVSGSSVQHVSVDPLNFGTTPGAECVLEIAGSLVHEMSFSFIGQAAGTVRDMAPGLLSDWALTGITDSQMSVHLANTQLENVNWLVGGSASIAFERCVAWQLGVVDSGQAIVRNGHVGQATLVFDAGQHVALRNLSSGELVGSWSLHGADPSTNVPFDYEVVNSTVDGWYLRIRGAEVTLEDCNLRGSRLRPEFDSDSSLTRVIRTYVDELMLWGSHGVLEFEDSTVHHIVTPVSSSTKLGGSFQVVRKELKTDWGPWSGSVVTREYPVRVVSQHGLPLGGAPVSLFGPSGSLVLTGRTNASGLFSFSIAFDDSNYAGTWHLQVGDSPGQTPVTLLTDTPIDLEGTESAAFRVVGPQGHVVAGDFFAAAFLLGSADVAEWAPVSERVEPGDVLELDTTQPGSYRLAQMPCSPAVAGVVSTEPGVVLGGAGSEGTALLALSGIVPVKVTNEGGPIQPGDLLVSSSTPGHAMRWPGPEPCRCALVGKALEAMTDERGVILVLLAAR